MEIVLNYDQIAGEIVEKLKIQLCNVDIGSIMKFSSSKLPESASPAELKNFISGMVAIDDLMVESKKLENICAAAREAGQTGPNLIMALFLIDSARIVEKALPEDSGWDEFIGACRESLKEEK